MKSLLCLFCWIVFCAGWAQDALPYFIHPEKSFRYRVYFTDKKNSHFSLRHPEAFLSPKALERRRKLKIKVDEYDLPVSPPYLKYLSQQGFKIHNCSKWNNTAVIETTDSTLVRKLQAITFVQQVKKVWESPDSVLVYPKDDRHKIVENLRYEQDSLYGDGYAQAAMLNVPRLHQQRLMGKGVSIAVIDGGFYNADCIAGLSPCHILGTKNFVHPNVGVYEEPQQHGTMVLSCMAAQLPNYMVGTAPDAFYYLLVSEDNESEHLVEEDNWCAALEHADSLGVDLVTTSLGYCDFDNPNDRYQYRDLNGETALNSRSASMAASRGILLISSAGNEGSGTWKKITFPADAKAILTVGAVNVQQQNADFSSVGNTADNRIKPDVMAMGEDVAVLNCYGNLTFANGTSFSAPILCGGIACLLQAFPLETPTSLIEVIRQTGDRTDHPDNIYGFGIPDLWKAYNLLKSK